jgi:hypothetical protein
MHICFLLPLPALPCGRPQRRRRHAMQQLLQPVRLLLQHGHGMSKYMSEQGSRASVTFPCRQRRVTQPTGQVKRGRNCTCALGSSTAACRASRPSAAAHAARSGWPTPPSCSSSSSPRLYTRSGLATWASGAACSKRTNQWDALHCLQHKQVAMQHSYLGGRHPCYMQLLHAVLGSQGAARLAAQTVTYPPWQGLGQSPAPVAAPLQRHPLRLPPGAGAGR